MSTQLVVTSQEIVIGWLGNVKIALPMLSFAHVWSRIGLSIVIFLTGLQTIDTALYESVEIDGTGFRQKFFRITVPSMVSTTTVLILIMTGAAKSFGIIKVTTNGGANGATEILATYIYKIGMTQNKYGRIGGSHLLLLWFFLDCLLSVPLC